MISTRAGRLRVGAALGQQFVLVALAVLTVVVFSAVIVGVPGSFKYLVAAIMFIVAFFVALSRPQAVFFLYLVSLPFLRPYLTSFRLFNAIWVFPSQALLLILVAAFVVKAAFLRERGSPLSSWLFPAFGAYLFVCALSITQTPTNISLNNQDFGVTWSARNIPYVLGITQFIAIAVALSGLFLVVYFVNSTTRLRFALAALLVGNGIASVIGIYEFFAFTLGLPGRSVFSYYGQTYDVLAGHTVHRISSVTSEPLTLTSYLSASLLLWLALLVTKQWVLPPAWQKLLTGATFCAFIMTFSRSMVVILATIVVLLVVAFVLQGAGVLKNSLRMHYGRVLLVIVVFLGVVEIFLLATHRPDLVSIISFDTVTIFESNYQGTFAHIASAKTGLNMFLAHPVLGVGVGDYRLLISRYAPLSVAGMPYVVSVVPSNTFAEVAAETGLLGLCSFGAILLIAWTRAAHALRATHDPFLNAVLTGLLMSVITLLVANAFMSGFIYQYFWVTLGLLVAATALGASAGHTANG